MEVIIINLVLGRGQFYLVLEFKKYDSNNPDKH